MPCYPDKVDLVGRRFGRLTAVEFVEVRDKNAYWKCLCDCGTTSVVCRCSLVQGCSRSCGCLNLETITRHGHCRINTNSLEYSSWESMNQRCLNPNNSAYRNYGGRGVTVCKRWRKFENFLEDMGPRPSRAYSLERVKNELGYSKSNCVWATKAQQVRNMRRNVWVTAFRKTQCLVDWSRELRMSYMTLKHRIQVQGMTPEQAMTLPSQTGRRQGMPFKTVASRNSS